MSFNFNGSARRSASRPTAQDLETYLQWNGRSWAWPSTGAALRTIPSVHLAGRTFRFQ